MTQLLGLVLLSFTITSFFMVPFIDFLFYLKRRFEVNKFDSGDHKQTPIHDQLMKGDEAIPSGGGILLVALLTILSIIYSFFTPFKDLAGLKILLFALVSFGLLGLIDDIKAITTKRQGKFLGLGRKTLFIIQAFLALIIAWFLYSFIGLNNIYVSGIGNFIIGWWYIPLAAFVIISFANAFNISDGLDGLSCGLLTICLFAFLALASATLDLNLASFIGIWIGSLFAYLYFNIWPARIFLGDAGAFGFGATLAVVGLLTGKILALGIIGGMFVLIVGSSLLQILSKKIFHKKILPVAPIHMYFKYIGWEEPKIVMRFWLAQALFAIFGLWMALLAK
ncbi:hypothetical protein HYW42_03075 [Candidatus Daviesbacteria bacterium]|nr:hypothetical protein [Candidatus Daviesbacteria bacterium]